MVIISVFFLWQHFAGNNTHVIFLVLMEQFVWNSLEMKFLVDFVYECHTLRSQRSLERRAYTYHLCILLPHCFANNNKQGKLFENGMQPRVHLSHLWFYLFFLQTHTKLLLHLSALFLAHTYTRTHTYLHARTKNHCLFLPSLL